MPLVVHKRFGLGWVGLGWVGLIVFWTKHPHLDNGIVAIFVCVSIA
jgi:hypothetical protein